MIRKTIAWVRDLTQSVLGPDSTSKPLEVDACWLEDRLLYSATALPIDLEGGVEAVDPQISQHEIDSLLALVNSELNADTAATSSADAITLDLPPLIMDGTDSTHHQVAFVDANLENLDQLLQHLQSSFDDPSQSLEVVLIDSRSSGIDQVNQYLSAADHDYSAVHLVTHGQAGQFQLGSDLIDLHSLGDHAEQLAMWQSGLTDDADLLIYGCQVASTADGQTLGHELAELLSVDVALSSTVTGSSDLGGDWILEYEVGQIDVDSHLDDRDAEQWQHVLDLTALGSESLVNGSVASSQDMTIETGGNIGMDASGRYVVSWQDNRAGNNDVYARVYNADGTPRTAEFCVTAANTTTQDWNSVAMADNGNFVVTWSDSRSGSYDVYMRMFDVDGNALTGETLVSTRTGVQDYHAVDFGSDGSFVVTFQDSSGSDIYFQRYNSSGVAVGSNTIVNSTTSNVQSRPDIAVRSDGSFIVTWTSTNQDNASSLGVYARIFNASGTAATGEFLVNQTVSGDQTYSSIDADSSGNFTIAWQSPDATSNGIYARRFNSAGTALGNEFQVNTYTSGAQTYAHVAMNSAGDFIVTWNEENGKDGATVGVYAQQFDSAGTRIGGEVLINSTTTGTQRYGTAGYVGSSAVWAWQGNGAGDSAGIFTRRFSTTNYSNITVNSTTDVSDGTVTSIAALLENKGADGVISLREAIAAVNNSANGTGGADHINFNIGTGLQTITIGTSALPTITGAVILDGWTQSGFSSSPLIELNGNNTGTLKDGLNLAAGAAGSTIQGFIINRFTGDGIEVASANNVTIQGNWIGLNNTGTTASANALRGINASSATGLTIGSSSAVGRNVISGNAQQGIYFDNVDNSFVYGNYVGTNVAGTGDVNGTTANTSQSGLVLTNDSSGNTIGNASISTSRNVFSGNNHYGLEVLGSTSVNNLVSNNYLGTTATGLSALGNTNGGVSFWGSGTGNVLSGNVISGNLGVGVIVGSGASGSIIQGNLVGLGANGSTSVGNANEGINVSSAAINTLIGSNADGSNDSAEANVISSNYDGIIISGVGTTGTMVYGNLIGTDSTGLIAKGNTFDGVRIENGATANLIGGSGAARRNIIASNGGDGVQVDGESSDNNTIQNNYIGVGSDGVKFLGNGGSGILVSNGADNTTIGGVGLGNVIIGSRAAGIMIDGASTGTIIRGNTIGINAAGTFIHGTGQSGILLANGASNTTIGGTVSGEGNTITDSGLLSTTYNAGIDVLTSASTGNTIVGNSVYGNVGIGINLGGAGVTANDTGDADTGPNNLQNYPALTAASVNVAGTSVTVSGTVNATASVTGLLLHFYATPAVGNVNAREGRRYLGSTTVNTDASGNATFSNITLTGYSGSVAAGELITATATTPGANGNTSEFSVGMVAGSTAGNSSPTQSQLTATTDGGLTINSSGYSSYLQAEDGSALLGGRTQLSMEFQFRGNSMTDPTIMTLASYATATDGDAFVLGALKWGGSELLNIQINGSSVTLATDVDQIFDGNLHSLAMTWTQTSGAYAFYLDGVALGSGTGLATGQSIASGGQFVLGADLDVGTDTWTPGALFRGTFYDVRMFSDVRSASEIAASYRSELPFNEGNLIANWRFEDLSTARVTSDSSGANDLAIRSFTDSGFTADTPSLELRLDENTRTGTVLGSVYGLDIDREAKITALLSADSSLRYDAETAKFYKLLSSTQTTYTTAASAASGTLLSGIAGQLVTIRSASENQFIQNIGAPAGNFIWLGATDEANEGTWRWRSGSVDADTFWQGTSTGYMVSQYSNFLAGEPQNSAANEDYGVLFTTDGQWRDTTGIAANVVAEWDADRVLDATNAVTYSITSQSVAGAFAINSSTGAITVANGALLNYEAQTSQTLTVRVTDGSGATFDKSFTVAIDNLTEESNSPTDLSSGINLNVDGGNNAYLYSASGGTVFGGRTGLSMESTVAITANSATSNPIVSYAVATNENEVRWEVTSSGVVSLYINSTAASTSAIPTLLDGKAHHMAVSWDNTFGDVRFYVDGQLVSTSTGVKAGYTIAAGGALVVGQEQDSVNGGYDANQVLRGTLYDLRVWNGAVSGEQISLNYQQTPGGAESGLVANWRMNNISGGNTIVDSVGGVNLTIANVAVGGSFVVSTPTTGLTVNENATVGTRVGQLIGIDSDISRDILLDGLFREAADPGTYATYTSGQTVGNWTVSNGSVDLLGTSYQSSPLGGRSIDLNGTVPGAITQSLTTVAGRQYQVIFSLSGNFGGGDATKDLRLSAAGASQDFSIAQPTGWSTTNMQWSSRSMTFTRQFCHDGAEVRFARFGQCGCHHRRCASRRDSASRTSDIEQ